MEKQGRYATRLFPRCVPKRLLREDVEQAYSYADLERRGEGSRWAINGCFPDGTYPLPDYFVGPYPRWLARTIRRHRDLLLAATRAHNEGR